MPLSALLNELMVRIGLLVKKSNGGSVQIDFHVIYLSCFVRAENQSHSYAFSIDL